MLEYPRWKYILVCVVLALGLLFALPSFFGLQDAVQVARKDTQAMSDADRAQIENALRAQHVESAGTYLDGGNVMVRFNAKDQQLKARDVVRDALDKDYRAALAKAPRAPQWLSAAGLKPMPLGLDLQGGLSLLYQVDVNGAVGQLLESYEQSFRRTLGKAEIAFTDVATLPAHPGAIADTLRISLPAGGDADAARKRLADDYADLSFSVASGGETPAVEMTLTPTQIRTRQDYAIEQTISTLRNRVNELGVAESVVKRQGLDRVNVQLPGVQNSAEVKDVIGKTATVEFRMEDQVNSAYEAQRQGRAPLGSKLYTERKTNQPVLLKREVIASGDQLTDAKPATTQDGPAVSITLNGQASDNMFRTTRLNVGKLMDIVYIEKSRQTTEENGVKVQRDVTKQEVISRATIRGVFASQFQITGLRAGESRELALLLRSGALAAPIYLVQESAVGPSVGAENISRGIHALVVGMLAVFVFMAIYYRGFGLIANLVLIFNVVLLSALLAAVHSALSLPGIAGMVLTVGMSVDANILIFERIREELRNGVTPQAAIRAGYEKAFSAIADANVTTLIAGIVLWVFGTGAIRGFAVVLTLGIFTSLFTAIIGSRALVTLLYGGPRKVARLSI